MRPTAVVMLGPLIKDPPSVDFAERDDVIEALSAYCSDKSLAMCISFR